MASAVVVRERWSAAGTRTRIPVVLFAATVLAQIAYPLTAGAFRDRLTIATVLLWTGTSLTHAVATRGTAFAGLLLVVSGGLGLVAELVGTATGVPFGEYHYTGGLGPQWAGVPLIIPLAWVMMAYPALLVGRLLGATRGTRIVWSAAALASWDLFLDPQMVGAGHWEFTGGGPRLNGIPLVNSLGWLLVSLLVMAVLEVRLPERTGADTRLPYALYLWTFVSSLLAAAAFFHRPGVALVGAVGMGAVAVPLARTLQRRRSRA